MWNRNFSKRFRVVLVDITVCHCILSTLDVIILCPIHVGWGGVWIPGPGTQCCALTRPNLNASARGFPLERRGVQTLLSAIPRRTRAIDGNSLTLFWEFRVKIEDNLDAIITTFHITFCFDHTSHTIKARRALSVPLGTTFACPAVPLHSKPPHAFFAPLTNHVRSPRYSRPQTEPQRRT